MRPPGGPARGVWTARDAVRRLGAKARDAVRGPPRGVPPPFACKWQAASRSGLSHREFFDISTPLTVKRVMLALFTSMLDKGSGKCTSSLDPDELRHSLLLVTGLVFGI